MNKIILVVLFALLGAALYLFVYPLVQPAIAPVLSFIASIPTNITLLTEWVQNNLATIIPTAAGVGTVATLLYNQVYKRYKQTQEQLTTQKVSDVQNELLTQIGKTEASEKTNLELQKQLDETKNVQGEIVSLKELVQAKQKEVEAATQRANEAERLAKALIPKEEPVKVP